ncbi:cleft lip and palate transmembrane protein 1-like protein [Octopus sinensis]|uniref:Lipid scramblase CLPTM1L n=1 Tax=Octopus sinensis TaxID=2607531 RepID=A0A6P7TCV4_9MOLL|nr:cleft lip and palate transmembrane protein 1-like protein [Octopus sinensis]XP_036366627.1 cleft lip and palate transmembrane protein 1-like protein [Octopus sinensis]
MGPSFSMIISAVFFSYIAYSLWVMVEIFYPKPCEGPPKSCLTSYLVVRPKPTFGLRLYTSTRYLAPSEQDLTLVWDYHNFSLTEPTNGVVNVTLPLKTRRNGTLYGHIFFFLRGRDPFLDKHTVHTQVPLTSYSLPESKVVNLLTDKTPNASVELNQKPVSHWRSKITINVVQEDLSLNRNAIPGELYRYIKFSPEGFYLPIVFIDELSNRLSDLQIINTTTRTMSLKVSYAPISIGKLRLWTSMMDSMKAMKTLGFKEKDVDELKGIFTDTNLALLLLTFAVSTLHLLFDFLAFKNDINFWRGKKSMEGLSSRGVVWRCVSTMIIFLFLLDQESSLLVLIPAGIGAFIEVWKVKKAFKLNITWSGWKPFFEFGKVSDKEKQTNEFDSEAMKYLSYVLYPLCICGAIYSLIYIQYKSWYSWFINSLVNGVYLFGFLFMLPQLFVNYKLKSVAHLPWRAFMYKAFNTFIDDVFAFIITMPTAHRLACFRDDVVFLIYLYQRWLYPVDKTRVNEYGMSYEEDKVKTDSKKKKKDE